MQICIYNSHFLQSNCIQVGQAFLENHHPASALASQEADYSLYMLVAGAYSSEVDIPEPSRGNKNEICDNCCKDNLKVNSNNTTPSIHV